MLAIWKTQLTNMAFLEFAFNPKVKEDDVVQRIDMSFLFSMIWSIGAVTDEHG